MTMIPSGRLWTTLALGVLILLAPACDDETLISPAPDATDELFERYVALGNSITAGFQSEGINRETQQESYAVLLAQQMGVPFDAPLLNMPGCPAPLTNPLTGERLGSAQPDGCALRSTPVPLILNNVAVPGAATLDPLSNLDPGSNPNPLTTLLLGGRTQLEAALDADPTFVSVWIGNNDVLGAAISGVVTDDNVTPVSVFSHRVGELLDGLSGGGVQGGVLIGVADVTLIPHLSPGIAYWSVAQSGALPPTFEVAQSCGPTGVGEQTLVPFSYGFGELLARASQGESVTLDCAQDTRVLSTEELVQLAQTVTAYNQVLAEEASNRGWAFFDPNPTFRELSDEGLIPVFPNLEDPGQLFGPVFSLDGVHPSAGAHRMVTNGLIDVINQGYGTSISPVDEPSW
ncbi:MAG: SGNH/GDSL hydrolase family protein [Gemmatimonadales bacterium]|nr:MAG: SGNH/GDSL hydrolase family protein [Gemmatimonadales bacterium]